MSRKIVPISTSTLPHNEGRSFVLEIFSTTSRAANVEKKATPQAHGGRKIKIH